MGNLTIDPTFILCAIAALVICLLLAAVAGSSRPKKERSTSQDISRWRVFSVHPAPLHSTLYKPQVVLREEPKGASLRAQASSASAVEITPDDTRSKKRREALPLRRAEIYERGFFRTSHHASINGKEWLTVRIPRAGKKRNVQLRFRRTGPSFSLSGQLQQREYEVRRGHHLAAIVSPATANENAAQYRLEVLKSEDFSAVVTLVLCLESALPPLKN